MKSIVNTCVNCRVCKLQRKANLEGVSITGGAGFLNEQTDNELQESLADLQDELYVSQHTPVTNFETE